MPFKKSNKHKIINQAIKRRLMEISIYVENFIYKNKPITLEEANKYVAEISLHRARCNNDAHILQVIEKLTRSLKIIIDGRSKLAPDTQRHSENKEESLVLITPYTVSAYDQYENQSKLKDTCVLTTTILAQTENKPDESYTTEVIVISESDNEEYEKENTRIPSSSLKCVNELFADNCKLNATKKNNTLQSSILCSNESVSKLNDTEENNRNDLATKNYLFNYILQVSNTSNANTEFDKPNEFGVSKNSIKNKVTIDYNNDVVLKNNENDNKATVSTDNTEAMPSLSQTGKENKKKKVNQKKKQILISGSQNLTDKNLNTNKATRGRKTTTITKNRKPRKQTINKKPVNDNKTTVAVIESRSSFAPSCSALTSKHTLIKLIDDNTIPLIHVEPTPTADVISTKMGALKIDNKLKKIDLSWINDVEYVREINTNEFEQTPNRYHDNFWTSYNLPNGWSDTEFQL